MELHTPKYVKVLQYVVMIIMALFMFFPIYWICLLYTSPSPRDA